MLLLSRYLVRNVFFTTLAISLALTLIIWLTQSLRLLDFIINGGAPLRLFAAMLILTVPKFFEIILPISLALGIIYSMNKFSTDSEVVVMHNTGASPMQLSQGILLFAVLSSLAVFGITGWGTPLANRQLDHLRDIVKSDYSLGMLRPGVFNVIGNDTTIYIAERTDLQDLSGVFIHFNKEGEPPTTITAERGGLVMREGKPFVVVVDGMRQQFNEKNGSIDRLRFKNYSLDLSSLVNKNTVMHIEPDERTLSDLWHTERIDSREGPQRLIAEFHQRLSKPLLTLAFALLALIPFMRGYYNRRGQIGRIFGITLGLITLQAINLGSSTLAGTSVVGMIILYGTPVLCILACWFSLYHPTSFLRRSP